MGYLKRILAISLALFVTGCILINPLAVDAAEEQLGEFKNEDNPSYYHIEALPDDEVDKGWFDKLKDNHWWMDPKDSFLDSMNQFMTFLVDVGFKINMFLTRLMIGAFDLAYSTNFMKSIIDKLDEVLQPITGIISNGTFGSTGIFGNFAQFVVVFTAFYAVFLLIWKRSMIESLSVILQTVVALAIALLLFTNYSTFLNGVNAVTTQASGLVLGGGSFKKDYDPVRDPNTGTEPMPTEGANDTPTGLNEDSLRMQMRNNLWSLFVDRPYLYLMYGKVGLDKIEDGKERVNKILKEPKGSEDREKILLKEVDEDGYDNDYMKYSNTGQRLAFTPIYLGINGITSIPVYILALLLIVFQFWFMLIAALAPFALIVGAVPGQFNIIPRYFIELGLPLVLKIVVAFGAVMVFAISEVLYDIDFNLTDGMANTFLSYIAASIIHFALFLLLFMLRHRIKSIFSAGSSGLQELRAGMQTASSPIKKGVQGTSIVGGAVVGGTVGAAAGGVGAIPGALSGASMGSSVGKASTGDGSPGDVARSAGHTAMAMKGKPDMKQSSSQTDLQSKTHPKQGKQASGDQQGQTGKQAGQAGQEKANNNQGNQNEQNNYQENEQSNRESQNQEEPPIQHGYQPESEGAYPAISLQQPYEEQPSGVQQENGQDHEMSQHSSNSCVQPYNNDVSHGDQEPYYLKPDTRSTNDHMAKENNERRLGKNPSQPNRERGAAQVDQEHSESAATLKPSNESSYDHYRKTEQWNEGNQLNQSETVEENNTVKSNPVSSKKSSDQIRNNRRTNYPDKTILDTGVDKPNTPTLDRSYTDDSNRKGDHLQ